MPLTLRSGFMTSTGEEGRLLMDSGAGDQIVIVTNGALKMVASPPRADEFRLQEYIDLFSTIASGKFDAGLLDGAGHVCVTVSDVQTWHTSSSAQPA